MPHRGEAPQLDPSGVEEVGWEELEPVWVEGMRASPDIQDEEEVQQLVAAQHRRRTAVDVRYFAARVEGRIASYCELFSDEKTGQIESVMTLRGIPQARTGQGDRHTCPCGVPSDGPRPDLPARGGRGLAEGALPEARLRDSGSIWSFLRPPPGR